MQIYPFFFGASAGSLCSKSWENSPASSCNIDTPTLFLCLSLQEKLARIFLTRVGWIAGIAALTSLQTYSIFFLTSSMILTAILLKNYGKNSSYVLLNSDFTHNCSSAFLSYIQTCTKVVVFASLAVLSIHEDFSYVGGFCLLFALSKLEKWDIFPQFLTPIFHKYITPCMRVWFFYEKGLWHLFPLLFLQSQCSDNIADDLNQTIRWLFTTSKYSPNYPIWVLKDPYTNRSTITEDNFSSLISSDTNTFLESWEMHPGYNQQKIGDGEITDLDSLMDRVLFDYRKECAEDLWNLIEPLFKKIFSFLPENTEKSVLPKNTEKSVKSLVKKTLNRGWLPETAEETAGTSCDSIYKKFIPSIRIALEELIEKHYVRGYCGSFPSAVYTSASSSNRPLLAYKIQSQVKQDLFKKHPRLITRVNNVAFTCYCRIHCALRGILRPKEKRTLRDIGISGIFQMVLKKLSIYFSFPQLVTNQTNLGTGK
ncbi:MAG: hypothetical protein AAGF04_05640 [Chlamydiota bacterium]